jgi:hypothetical protein
LCTLDRLPQVKEAIQLTGSPDPTLVDGTAGMPEGWIGLRGVVPHRPVTPNPAEDILNILRPLPDAEIVLKGGIRLERTIWLDGYPPRIRLLGDPEGIGEILIDGKVASCSSDGSFIAPGWDTVGQHTVWCRSNSRTYSIAEGAEDWDEWGAYAFSITNPGLREQMRLPLICGPLIFVAEGCNELKQVVVPTSNPVVVGSKPGEIFHCWQRPDIRPGVCLGFVGFDPVWALPSEPLRCDKRTARILFFGKAIPVCTLVQQRNLNRQEKDLLRVWSSVITAAGMKGLKPEPSTTETADLWRGYRRHAKAIKRSLR